MKRVWVGNSYSGNTFANEIAELLGRDDFDVELFGVWPSETKLPSNYQIVDYGSRETLIVCLNGEIIDDPEELRKLEEEANLYD